MGKTSDTKGKAFEFILSETLCNRLKLYGYTVNLTQDFTECQKTDSLKFASLLPQEINYFTSQSELTSDWFIHLLSSFHTKNVTLNRLPDSKGTKGNPTDIEIITSLKQINISAKHNNFSIKHQRLPSLFQQLGMSKKVPDDKIYRDKLKQISNNFYSFAHSVDSKFTLFSEVKNVAPESINEKLYEPSLDLYCNTLKIYQSSLNEVKSFFNFLLGKIDFYHVKMDSKRVVIKNYSSVSAPTSFHLSKVDRSNQVVHFDNGFSFKLRIHTASSRLEDCGKNCCSMKIDATIVNEPSIPAYEL